MEVFSITGEIINLVAADLFYLVYFYCFKIWGKGNEVQILLIIFNCSLHQLQQVFRRKLLLSWDFN